MYVIEMSEIEEKELGIKCFKEKISQSYEIFSYILGQDNPDNGFRRCEEW